jgi:dolichyl-phosphate-mannose--protein O-mannosyl transferase
MPGSHLLGDPVLVWWMALASKVLVVLSVIWTATRRAEGDD